MPSGRRLPPELEALAERLGRQLASAWRGALDAIIFRWRKLHRDGHLTANTARLAVRTVLADWPIAVAMLADPELDRLYGAGFLYGISDTGVIASPDQGDENVLAWLKTNPNGFIPALRNLADDNVRSIEGVISDAYAGYDAAGERRPFNLVDMVERTLDRVDIGVNRARLIVRTETAKATAYGRIMAWGDDPDRDWFEYHWIAHHDDRTKDVSLKFEREGPYEYIGIRKLWEVDHNTPVLVRNRHTGKLERQTSAFNCRCTPARTPKTAKKLYDEGKITYAEYIADVAGGGQVEWRPVEAA